ncbi:Uu.00g096690.m01.CDS01 [Anthostomella pinea]|uniref:Uu.00g096690.m01.CDS01 n=1 Tax=Anthostomella pinea TaxID=933095 RepID=A0AAI8YEY6_9PEZI|nr:Uu.00g096690.m01.CDS01 [Anthostomella pinea]
MPPFTDTTLFPAFYELPTPAASDIAAAPNSPDDTTSWYLLAQIKENMTLTKPTLICTDRRGMDFAITFEDTAMSLRGFKKGHMLVVRRAARTERGEGKKAVVRVEAGRSGDAYVIPGGLEQVFELGFLLDREGVGEKCAACEKMEGPLMKCTGCGIAAYCSKACQAKGWSEMLHKSNCKVLKSIKEIWG